MRALGCRDVTHVIPVSVSSTAVHLLHVAFAGGRESRFILRRFIDQHRLRTDPWYVPRHEAAALEALMAGPVPVPRLVSADVDATECDVPTLLTACLPGRSGDTPTTPVSERMLEQLAEALAVIHTVNDGARTKLPTYEPYYPIDRGRVPPWSTDGSVWRRAIALLREGQPPATEPCFIHRDYHPGNTLWIGERLTGVIDWTTACIGPPGIDLARMRQNLALQFGPLAAERFLNMYVHVTGRRYDRHPWWDLVDAVDMLVDIPPPQEPGQTRRLRRWEAYIKGVVLET